LRVRERKREEHEWWCEGVENAGIIGGLRVVGCTGISGCDGSVISGEELWVDVAVLNQRRRWRSTLVTLAPLAIPVTGSNPPKPEYPPSGMPPVPLN
jgi:hypothetical protein